MLLFIPTREFNFLNLILRLLLINGFLKFTDFAIFHATKSVGKQRVVKNLVPQNLFAGKKGHYTKPLYH